MSHSFKFEFLNFKIWRPLVDKSQDIDHDFTLNNVYLNGKWKLDSCISINVAKKVKNSNLSQNIDNSSKTIEDS